MTMPRPRKQRNISFQPDVVYFKPQGVPMMHLKTICLEIDELEAIRLADLEGMYHNDAAEVMHVSRQTFGNIINSAHRKIAEALISGKAIRIEGHVEIDITERSRGRRRGRD
jgi:predicted DNA-binding protein (UPF0251 family)